MNDCRDQLDGRWNDGRAARWAGVDLLGCDENALAIEPVITRPRIKALSKHAATLCGLLGRTRDGEKRESPYSVAHDDTSPERISKATKNAHFPIQLVIKTDMFCLQNHYASPHRLRALRSVFGTAFWSGRNGLDA